MANHYRAVGFQVATEEEFGDLLDRAVEEGEEMAVDGGRMFCWSPVDGAQVWLLVDDEWNFRGCGPHFNGNSLVPLGVTDMRATPDFWEGSAHAWVNPQQQQSRSGEYPFCSKSRFLPLSLFMQVRRASKRRLRRSPRTGILADAASSPHRKPVRRNSRRSSSFPVGCLQTKRAAAYAMFAAHSRYERPHQPLTHRVSSLCGGNAGRHFRCGAEDQLVSGSARSRQHSERLVLDERSHFTTINNYEFFQ
jgi:hypothetical protein